MLTVSRASEQRSLPARRRDAKMLIGQLRGCPAPGGTVQEPNLNEEGFVDLFDCVGFFCQRGGKRIYAHWTALILLNNGQQKFAIDFVETVLIHFQHLQRGLRSRQVDFPGATHLSIIAYPAKKPVRDTRSSPGAAGNFHCSRVVNLNSENLG